ncbi:MAG TPA: fibronectin type III-like domain-contianing protein, partial [Pyrinomonadaceae bacterium]
DYNPAGRLVQTWPRSLDQLPPMMDYDIRHGRTYMYFKGEPLYPFGYGMSYTTFGYTNLRVRAPSFRAGSSIRVNVDIRNTGSRAGEEVVQLYLKYLNSSVIRPLKALQGFKRISLRPGEIKTVTLELKPEQLAYWNVSRHKFVVENGAIQLMIGNSSSDIKLTRTIKVR